MKKRCEACPARNKTVAAYRIGARVVDLCAQCAIVAARLEREARQAIEKAEKEGATK